jgi:PAS domain S-box-containing protein
VSAVRSRIVRVALRAALPSLAFGVAAAAALAFGVPAAVSELGPHRVGFALGVALAALLYLVLVVRVAIERARGLETSRRLRDSEARHRLLFERSGAAVYQSTGDGRLLDCNEAFLKILGFRSREEALARPTTSLWANAGSRAVLLEQLHREGSVTAVEMPLVRADGAPLWALGSLTLVPGADPSEQVIQGTLLDIGERQAAAEALRVSESGMRALLENMLGGLIVVDDQSVIELVNPAARQMFGYTSEELVGQHLGILVPPRDGVPRGAFLKAALARSLGRVTEWEGRRKDGSVFPLELSLFQFEGPRGHRIAGNIVDVTQRHEVDRLKREFVSTVSHELRTPLTSIRGSLGLLAGGVLGPLTQDAQEIVAVAERNVVRLIGIINDILDLERLEGGRLEIRLEAVEAAAVVARAVESVRGAAEAAGVRLEVEGAAATVRGDADRLVQVLVNLIGNATKFSPAGSAVTVRTVPAGALCEFQVEDRGRGVPEELREAIFERYRQVEAGDARAKGGAGLGLAICKSIVEQHGGSIGVRSEAGRGSTFWFRIPCGSAPRLSGTGHAARPRAVVLLVDDDEELLSILSLRLVQERFAVRTATTSNAAIASARDLRPDLLVLDLGLPGGDGSVVVRALEKVPALAKTPLLVYTGRDLDDIDRRALVLGPTAYLTKSREGENEFLDVAKRLVAAGRQAGGTT